MNEQQKRFADYYIETGIAVDSYKRAGYKAKGKSIEVNASRLLSNAKVTAYIEERLKLLDDITIAKQEEVLKYLTKVMRREEKEYTVVTLRTSHSWYEDGKKQTKESEKVEIVPIPSKLSDSNKAAELLGKRYAMWTDRQQLDANVGVTIVDDIDD